MYGGEVESLSDAGSSGLGVRAFIDGRAGYAYGTDLSDGGVRAVAEAARAAAAVADPDEYAGLPEEPGVTAVEGLASPAMGRWTNEDRVQLALAVERAARSRAGITQVENAVYADSEGSVGDRQLAWPVGLLLDHQRVGLRLRLRGRGRGSDDGHWASGLAATRGRWTPRRSASRPPTGRWHSWARAGRRAAAAP